MSKVRYIGISDSIFDEPEYRNQDELLVAQYLIMKRDMCGVTPIVLRNVAAACRCSKGRVKRALVYFEEIGKCKISENFTHIWWKSGIFHSLFKGKCSKTQLISVGNLLKKWQKSGVFGQDFFKIATQHIENKYSLSIPYPTLTDIHIQTQNQNQTHIQTQTDVEEDNPPTSESEEIFNPEKYRGCNGDRYYKYDHSKTMIENVMAWAECKEAGEKFDGLAINYGGDIAREWIDKIFEEDYLGEVKMKSDEMKYALFHKHGGSIESHVYSWIKVAKKNGSLEKFVRFKK